MIKTFLKNSFIYTIGTVLTRGIGIILLPIYTRYLTPVEYGVIDLFMILASILSLTIALEIFQAVARFYPTASEKDRVGYVSSSFWFTMFMYIIYMCVSFYNADYFTILLLDDTKYLNVFYLATLSIATSGIFYFTSNQLKWQIMPKETVIVSVMQVSSVAIVAIYLLTVVGLKIESIFIGQIIGNVIGSLMAINYAKENYKFVFDYKKFIVMIEFSYPLVFSGIAIFISLFIDRIFIKEFLGLDYLGLYGVAYRFAAITSLVMVAFQSSLMPLVYKHYQEKDTPKNIAKLFDIFSIFALFIVMGSILFSKEILILMTTKAYYEAAPLIPLLVMAVFFNNMYIFAPGLGIAKKTKIVMIISFVSALINIVLNYIFISIYGLEGVAFATLTSACIVFIIRLVASNEYYKIPYNVYNLILSLCIALSITYATNLYLNEINLSNVAIKTIVLMIVTVTIGYLLLGKDNVYIILRKLRIMR